MKQKLDVLEFVGLARLHELFAYYPSSGKLIWKITVGSKARVGDVAGRLTPAGYRRISVGHKNLSAHRIAWYMTHGRLPKRGQIDHINGSRADNRLENLREVTRQENGKNKKKPTINTSGILGVYWDKKAKKWRAQITVDGKLKYLEYFDDIHEAAKARKAAEKDLGFHHNHGKR